jgi:hypothetical protein
VTATAPLHGRQVTLFDRTVQAVGLLADRDHAQVMAGHRRAGMGAYADWCERVLTLKMRAEHLGCFRSP